MEKDGDMSYLSKILSQTREAGSKKKGYNKIRDHLMAKDNKHEDRHKSEKL